MSESTEPAKPSMIRSCAEAIANSYVPAMKIAGVDYNPTDSVDTIEQWIMRCADDQARRQCEDMASQASAEELADIIGPLSTRANRVRLIRDWLTAAAPKGAK